MKTPLLALTALLALSTVAGIRVATIPPIATKNGIDYVVEQPPVFNSPTLRGYDALGLSRGCGSCCDEVSSIVDLGSEAVLLHSGQEVRTERDLDLSGRDSFVDFRILRRHTSRFDDELSPFGKAWSFNYRHTFTITSGTLEFRGFGRVDEFVPVSGKANQWDGQTGRLERAIWTPDTSPATTGTMSVRRPDGTTLFFHGDDDGTGTIVGHMTEIRSRNGNSISITYEDEEAEAVLLDRRILSMSDSFGRPITFEYANSSHPQFISKITDFSGRFVEYSYDRPGNLIAATTNPIGAHGISGAGFSSGLTRTYAYRGLTSTPLEHALSSITYPVQSATSGPERLSWTYYEGTETPLY